MKGIFIALFDALEFETLHLLMLLIFHLFFLHGEHVSLFVLLAQGGEVSTLHIVLEGLGFLVVANLETVHLVEELFAADLLLFRLESLQLGINSILIL